MAGSRLLVSVLTSLVAVAVRCIKFDFTDDKNFRENIFFMYFLLMGRQIILKWSYLMIFMRVLVAVSVRWCKV